ncbi:MAG TPA: complex I NDUFA9 subunit family protein [Abditibacteriaceae bacterium]|jgi:NADH dehydrogenase
MKIFLTGATGFIGGHVLQALVEQNHQVTCLVRGQHTSSQRLLSLPGVRLLEGEWTTPESWIDQVAGHDVVINTVGIIREKRGATFEAVHTTAPIALFDAAGHAGAHKIIQISAMGADEEAVSRYHLSKRGADRHLARSGVPHVILRPSFVYGPGDHSMSFFARLAALPVTPVPGDGQYRFQPLLISDLVRAIIVAVEDPNMAAVTVDVGGSQILTFNTLLDVLARQRGKRQCALKLHIPWPIMRLVAIATDLMGGRGPITHEELVMLKRGSFADNQPFIARFGFEPVPFESGILQTTVHNGYGAKA